MKFYNPNKEKSYFVENEFGRLKISPSPGDLLNSIDDKLTILINLSLFYLQSLGFDEKTLQSLVKPEEVPAQSSQDRQEA